MSQFFQVHPENPQARLVSQAVAMLRQGAVIVYPTDSGYALGCQLGEKEALERIRRIRRLAETPTFHLVCRYRPEARFQPQERDTVHPPTQPMTPDA